MLLDRIDIDAHGPLHHVELGPLAEHLNVVFGPQGSGKTAIVRFVRDTLVDRQYPQGMLSSSSGRVVWADRNGLVHCRREQDGTPLGRRTVEFEPRGDFSHRHLATGHAWLDGHCESRDSVRAVRSLQLPESIVDGVITDTTVTSVARVVSACARSGLDSLQAYQSLPLHDGSFYARRDQFGPRGRDQHTADIGDDERNRRLRQELAEIDAELARLEALGPPATFAAYDRDRQDRLTKLYDQANRLRAQQGALRRWIAEIDLDLNRRVDATHPVESTGYDDAVPIADQHLRRRLSSLDEQLIRWRRALAEVRGLRQTILSDSYRNAGTLPFDAGDDAALRRLRLDGFLHAVDRYDRTYRWNDFYPAPYQPLHYIDDIDYRIESATRQIDWLLSRYADVDPGNVSWYQPVAMSEGGFATATLGDALRHIRDDLRHVRASTVERASLAAHADRLRLDQLQRDEQWLLDAIEQLNRHRETLLRHPSSDGVDPVYAQAHRRRHDTYAMHNSVLLFRDRRESADRLKRVTADLNRCLREAAELRRSMRQLPVLNRSWYDDHDPSTTSPWDFHWEQSETDRRIDSLRRRRSEILRQLRVVDRPVTSRSPLADAASVWLVRLSGGRLRNIAWPDQAFRADRRSYHAASDRDTGVTIDGRHEHSCAAADRALAVLAVRMAAGDLLARADRHVPLILEIDRYNSVGLSSLSATDAPLAYFDNGDSNRRNHPIASALRDYTRAGRQVVLLTADRALAFQLSRVGARTYEIHSRPIVHAHRPLWKPHFQPERYVGPHPHTYGHRDADQRPDPSSSFDNTVDRMPRAANGPLQSSPVADANRDFDMAWREAYGVYDNPHLGPAAIHSAECTDWPRDGYDFRDGFYVTDSFTTNVPQPNCCDAHSSWNGQAANHHRNGRGIVGAGSAAGQTSPFFLTVDSPIDQAPSIDAVAAARLRGLQITHINHLMQQDSNRLADALGLVNVDAATIRRWQSECRLVCRVPQLRGFDARVLVGCGVTTPAQLAAIHPIDLLQKVESFLATDRGQKILLSGSSHELSRITSWIAAANSSDGGVVAGFGRRRAARTLVGNGRHVAESLDGSGGLVGRDHYGRLTPDSDDYDFDHARYEYQSGTSQGIAGRSGRRSLRSTDRGESRRSGRRSGRRGESSSSNLAGRHSAGRSAARSKSRRSDRSRSGRTGISSGRQSRDVVRYDRQPRRYESSARQQRDAAATGARHSGPASRGSETEHELQFYLHRESPIVDAPSIGSRMAERLNALGIDTVDDLLNADAETVASELDHRRVDADRVLEWQQQATLVCRVPMLRGHDAQLLVAAEVTTPEELAAYDAETLFSLIDPIAHSNEGKRIIRGGKRPDLAEVADWIRYGAQHRELIAA